MSILTTLLVAAGLASPADSQGVPLSYFGMHYQASIAQNLPPPSLNVGAYRISGRVSWRYVEQAAGVYTFSTAYGPPPTASLNQYVYDTNYAGFGGVIYAISQTPTFAGGSASQTTPPTSWSYLGDFSTELASVYGTRISVEGMNEFNFFIGTVGSGGGCPGTIAACPATAAQIVTWQSTVYPAVKAANSATVVISPSTTNSGTNGYGPTIMAAYLAAGGNAAGMQDVMAFHGYQQTTQGSIADVDTMIQDYITTFTTYGVNTLPMWMTEGSWGQNSGYSTASLQAAFTCKYLLVPWGWGVARNYWYAFDDNLAGDPAPPSSTGWGTLWTANGLTQAGVAWQQCQKWMLGARIAKRSIAGTVWTIPVTRPVSNPSYGALAIWDEGGGPTTYTPDPKYTQYRDVTGAITPISGNITLTGSAILLETGSVF